jgi:dinuclear metal center YbgI/SA1388 family protein
MPARLADLIAEADRLLEPERFDDYCLNGVQVPGADTVELVVTGVSAHAELFELAAGEGAQLVLVHHGLFWRPGVIRVDPPLKRRLQLLFDAGITLAAYHLPLDAHPDIGNNALIARALDALAIEPFALHRGRPIGCIAELPGGGLTPAELLTRAHALTSREPLLFDTGPERIERLAIVSGAGAEYLDEAAQVGAHALLTGEAPERAPAQARELGLHLLAAGHYATETFGIRRLGEQLAERFGVEHSFLDVPNPL